MAIGGDDSKVMAKRFGFLQRCKCVGFSSGRDESADTFFGVSPEFFPATVLRRLGVCAEGLDCI